MKEVTCTAPVNIAVVKYWGKRDEELILPLNSSISVTLNQNQLRAKTTVTVSPQFIKDSFSLNNKEESFDNPRLQSVLKAIRCRGRKRNHNSESNLKWHVHICSENNFPTAAGLASSAAGYACLAYALAEIYDVKGDVSDIARIGSGSACRSLYGGFVEWTAGEKADGSDSRAHQLFDELHWPDLKILILVVNDKEKATGSTSGMQQSVKTSPLLCYRASQIVPLRVEQMKEAMKEKNFEKFADITMQESNQFHAVCQDTHPPIFYMNDTSRLIVQMVHAYNKYHGTTKLAYTFDAGPNACLFLMNDTVEEILSLINHYFPSTNTDESYIQGTKINIPSLSQELLEKVKLTFPPMQDAIKYIINTEVGPGPRLLESQSDNILQSTPKDACDTTSSNAKRIKFIEN